MLSLLLALASTQEPTPQHYFLDVADTTLGGATLTPDAEYLGLVPGHELEFRVSGPAGEPVFVALARDVSPPDPWLPGTLEISANPIATTGPIVLDAEGLGRLGTRVPLGVPAGLRLRSQALGRHPLDPFHLIASNSIAHETTDLQGDLIQAELQSVHPLVWTGGVVKLVDAVEWTQFWELHDGGFPPKPVPEVDFERQFVVASFFGPVPTTSYSIELLGIDVTGGDLVLQQRLTTPGFGCGDSFSMLFPHVFVAVDRVAIDADVSAVTEQVPGPPCD
ncbi:MAG: hypothetical protein AAFZ65_18150 [Planctomycetota bacterium]